MYLFYLKKNKQSRCAIAKEGLKRGPLVPATHWFEQSTRAKDIQEVESFAQKLVYQDKNKS